MSPLSAQPDPGAIVFDLDGTLVATVDQRIEAWLLVFAEVGLPAERVQVAPLIGSDGKRLALEVASAAGRLLTEAELESIDRRSGEIYDELNTNPRPTSGAPELLRALTESGMAWAIATSSRAAQVGTSVAALGLAKPPLIVDGSHVRHAKPAPDLLLLAAERLGQPPADCWYVGDSTWDMRAARAASMVAVGVTYGAVGADELRAAGALVVTTLDELAGELHRRRMLSD